jgi:hypothetical protein
VVKASATLPDPPASPTKTAAPRDGTSPNGSPGSGAGAWGAGASASASAGGRSEPRRDEGSSRQREVSALPRRDEGERRERRDGDGAGYASHGRGDRDRNWRS